MPAFILLDPPLSPSHIPFSSPSLRCHFLISVALQETDYNAPKDLHYMRGKCLDTKQVTDTYKRELQVCIRKNAYHCSYLLGSNPIPIRLHIDLC